MRALASRGLSRECARARPEVVAAGRLISCANDVREPSNLSRLEPSEPKTGADATRLDARAAHAHKLAVRTAPMANPFAPAVAAPALETTQLGARCVALARVVSRRVD